MNIEVLHEANTEIFDALVAGVREFNGHHMGNEKSQALSVVARDDSGKIIAGVAGRTIYQQLLIEVLWVAEALETRG